MTEHEDRQADGEASGTPQKATLPEDTIQQIHEKRQQESQTELVAIQHYEEAYSGPIPHPRIIGQYENIAPGSADRIFTMAEKQMEHRHTLETAVVTANIAHEKLAMFLGTFLATIVIVGGFIALFMGRDVVGVGLIVTPAVSIATVFFIQRRSRSTELAEKQERLNKPTSPQLSNKGGNDASPADTLPN